MLSYIPNPTPPAPLSNIFSPATEQPATFCCCGQSFSVMDFLTHNQIVHRGCPATGSLNHTALAAAASNFACWPQLTANTRIVSKLPPPVPSTTNVLRSPDPAPKDHGSARRTNHRGVVAPSSPAETPQSQHWAVTTSMTPRSGSRSHTITPAKSGPRSGRRKSAPSILQGMPESPDTPTLKKSRSRVGRLTTSLPLKMPKRSQPKAKGKARAKKARTAESGVAVEIEEYELLEEEDDGPGYALQRTPSTSSTVSASSQSSSLPLKLTLGATAPASRSVVKIDRRCPPSPGPSPPSSAPVSRCTSPAHAALFPQEDPSDANVFSSESCLLRTFLDASQAADFMMITPSPSPQTVGASPEVAIAAPADLAAPVAVLENAQVKTTLLDGPADGEMNLAAWLAANEGIFQPLQGFMDVDATWDKISPLPVTLDGHATSTPVHFDLLLGADPVSVETSAILGPSTSSIQSLYEPEIPLTVLNTNMDTWETLQSQTCDSPAAFLDAATASSASPVPLTADDLEQQQQLEPDATTRLLPADLLLSAAEAEAINFEAERSWRDLIHDVDMDDDAISRMFEDIPMPADITGRKDSAYAESSPPLSDCIGLESEVLIKTEVEEPADTTTAALLIAPVADVAVKVEGDGSRKAFICTSSPFAPSGTLVTPRGFGAFKVGTVAIPAVNRARRGSSPLSTFSFASASTAETVALPISPVPVVVVVPPTPVKKTLPITLAPSIGLLPKSHQAGCYVEEEGKEPKLGDADVREDSDDDCVARRRPKARDSNAPVAKIVVKRKAKEAPTGGGDDDGAWGRVKRAARGCVGKVAAVASASAKMVLKCEVAGCIKVYQSKTGLR
ncbi:hypothetical protein HK101_000753 [Irineochytrium annulatum]|nr:hypothetical protein HK101_000753 [Irineochytrium annulatum]